MKLVVRDTAADPRKAEASGNDLARVGVAAVVGEYQSVATRAAAIRADSLGLTFLCSSAVLDAIVDEPTDEVARLAPPQSHGWRIYADFPLRAGHRRIAAVTDTSIYWAAGARILRARLAESGGDLVELDAVVGPDGVCDALVANDSTTVLLLVGHPEPAVSLVRALRVDRRLGDVMIGAPAGQLEFADWAAALGAHGAEIPFLRYMPERLDPLGARVESLLRNRLSQAPSFVAFEGYDAVAVLADLLRSHDDERLPPARSWPLVASAGTRGRIRFSRRQQAVALGGGTRSGRRPRPSAPRPFPDPSHPPGRPWRSDRQRLRTPRPCPRYRPPPARCSANSETTASRAGRRLRPMASTKHAQTLS